MAQIVPGPKAAIERHPWGVRYVVQAPAVPGTGYRIILGSARVRALLEALAPDRIEVHDRTTLRWVGRWARAHGIPSLVISHERLDRVLATWLPWLDRRHVDAMADRSNRALARDFDQVLCTTAWAGEEFHRIGVSTLRTVPLGGDLESFHPPADPHPATDDA